MKKNFLDRPENILKAMKRTQKKMLKNPEKFEMFLSKIGINKMQNKEKYNKIYVSIPYSHKDELVREERFELATKIAGELIENGNIVFSPVTHSHIIAKQEINLPITWDFWKQQLISFIDWCDIVVVVNTDGWEESTGVKEEIEYALHNNKKVVYYYANEKFEDSYLIFKNIDYADEFWYPIFSILSGEELKSMKKFIQSEKFDEYLEDNGYSTNSIEFYFGTNESIEMTKAELLELFNNAKIIDYTERNVLDKFIKDFGLDIHKYLIEIKEEFD